MPRRTPRPRPRGSSARGWLTLVALAVAVIAVSLGPTTLRELFSGLTYVRPPAASLPPPLPHAEPALQQQLERVAGSVAHGRMSVAAVDLQSGASASVDAARTYPAASLFKVPLLLEVLVEQDAGRLRAEQLLEIRPEDWTDGSGVLQARVGERLTVRELARLMIQESDNIAALVLLDAVGVPSVNATAESLGLHATRVFDHRAGDVTEHTTSAADMAHLLVLLATGQAVNQHVSESALSLLELKQSATWLSTELPFWVKVAHKWGDLPQARNDAGVVFSPRGSFVVVALTEGSQPDEAAAAIGRAARAVYDFVGTGR